ncbi:hypothetical protein EVAR_76046_1 [Eumeta japonica]|uniref:Uncharacterized protein n=1 Tax=Eumeta variegata TaxID=151549 RepID=A0A4C1UAI7_EUMVA|nr:hypothetical protein EVAR_76046_1 [Eumeta japonica]
MPQGPDPAHRCAVARNCVRLPDTFGPRVRSLLHLKNTLNKAGAILLWRAYKRKGCFYSRSVQGSQQQPSLRTVSFIYIMAIVKTHPIWRYKPKN